MTAPAVDYSGVTDDGAGFTGVAPYPADPTAYAPTGSAVVPPDLVPTTVPEWAAPAPDPYDRVVLADFTGDGTTFVAGPAADSPLDHGYRVEWHLGPVTAEVDDRSAMAAAQNRPLDVFPFDIETADGRPPRLAAGARLNLRATPIPFDDNHVVVTEISATSVEFTTKADHFRGAGTRIQFSTLQRDGQVYLVQEAEETTSWLAPLYDAGARIAWQAQAANVRAILYGGTGPRGFPWARSSRAHPPLRR